MSSGSNPPVSAAKSSVRLPSGSDASEIALKKAQSLLLNWINGRKLFALHQWYQNR
jgi:hypothetical protein